ncbi:MAG TPA: methyl-accepting chemotaxis protein [Firmicutes bacterium]|nr:methyl-accepting chemotaxis protein [Candidatus Fermentithermobacillaceae bacterium]
MRQFFDAILPLSRAWRSPSAGNFLTVFWILVSALLFIYSLYVYLTNSRKCRKDLVYAANALKQLVNSTGREEGNEGDTGRDRVQEVFANLRDRLGSPWRGLERCFFTVLRGDSRVRYSSVDPAEYINLDSLLGERMNRKLLSYMPSILTGWGILGTFMGLTVGLEGLIFSGHDVEALRSGIQTLLDGMSVAFTSSLWGILFSLILGWIQRVVDRGTEGRIQQLHDALCQLVPVRTPEEILGEILWQDCEQTSELKKFNEDLAISIAAALDEKMAARLTPTLEKLFVAIENLSQTGSSELSKAIVDRANNEIADLGKTLANLSSAVSTVSEKVSVFQQESLQKVQELLSGLESGVQTTVKEASQQQVEAGSRMFAMLEQFAQRVDSSLTAQASTLSNITSGVLGTLMEQVREMTEAVKTVIDELDARTKSMMAQMEGRLREVSNSMSESAQDISQRYLAETKQVQALIEELASASDAIGTIVREARSAARMLAESAAPVTSAIQQLSKVSSEFSVTQRQLFERVSQIQQEILTSQEAAQRSLASMNDMIASAQNLWHTYKEGFTGLSQELSAVLSELDAGLGEYTERVNKGVAEFLKTLDQHTADITGKLAGAIEELGEDIGELLEFAEKTKGGVGAWQAATPTR